MNEQSLRFLIGVFGTRDVSFDIGRENNLCTATSHVDGRCVDEVVLRPASLKKEGMDTRFRVVQISDILIHTAPGSATRSKS